MKPTPSSPAPDDGRTVQRREGRAEPRLPHERDESADDQGAPPGDLGRQAQNDVNNGQQDTDRGPVLDQTYRRQKRPSSEG